MKVQKHWQNNYLYMITYLYQVQLKQYLHLASCQPNYWKISRQSSSTHQNSTWPPCWITYPTIQHQHARRAIWCFPRILNYFPGVQVKISILRPWRCSIIYSDFHEMKQKWLFLPQYYSVSLFLVLCVEVSAEM